MTIPTEAPRVASCCAAPVPDSAGRRVWICLLHKLPFVIQDQSDILQVQP